MWKSEIANLLEKFSVEGYGETEWQNELHQPNGQFEEEMSLLFDNYDIENAALDNRFELESEELGHLKDTLSLLNALLNALPDTLEDLEFLKSNEWKKVQLSMRSTAEILKD